MPTLPCTSFVTLFCCERRQGSFSGMAQGCSFTPLMAWHRGEVAGKVLCVCVIGVIISPRLWCDCPLSVASVNSVNKCNLLAAGRSQQTVMHQWAMPVWATAPALTSKKVESDLVIQHCRVEQMLNGSAFAAPRGVC